MSLMRDDTDKRAVSCGCLRSIKLVPQRSPSPVNETDSHRSNSSKNSYCCSHMIDRKGKRKTRACLYVAGQACT